jgi:hypothetical protein
VIGGEIQVCVRLGSVLCTLVAVLLLISLCGTADREGVGIDESLSAWGLHLVDMRVLRLVAVT